MFNKEKTDYEKPSLFLGQEVGLFDTINKQYPDIWKIYKTMKSLDWDENEFDYSSCQKDFKNCDKDTKDMMIKTLAFQWESDSVASRISPIAGIFVTSSELWAAWQKLSEIEVLHVATYSEIVRNSFDNPREILDEVLSIKESFDRLHTVESTLKQSAKAAFEYAAGLRENDQDLYDHAFMFAVSMFLLERIQFMASFAVTFAIVDTGLFQPIGKAVQKIAQDEFETHVDLDKAVLRHEMKTERGKLAFERNKERINLMINEVVDSEMTWIDYLFSDGRQLVGMNASLLKDWMLFCAKDVYRFFNMEAEHKLPAKNPLKFMENWLDISRIQASPQEQDNAQYKVGILRHDDAGEEFDVDF